jgi:hypothetical protein
MTQKQMNYFRTTFLSQIPEGELFRFSGRKKIYTYDGKNSQFEYCYTAYSNDDDSYAVKEDKAIEVDFYFYGSIKNL